MISLITTLEVLQCSIAYVEYSVFLMDTFPYLATNDLGAQYEEAYWPPSITKKNEKTLFDTSEHLNLDVNFLFNRICA